MNKDKSNHIIFQKKPSSLESKHNLVSNKCNSSNKRKNRKRKRNGLHRRNKNNKRYKSSNQQTEVSSENFKSAEKSTRSCAQTWDNTYHTIIAWQFQREAAFWKAHSADLENKYNAILTKLEEMQKNSQNNSNSVGESDVPVVQNL